MLSGVLFGIAHGDPYAAIPLALGGIVLCAVYYLSRNAYASMISHALFNSFSIVLLLFFPQAHAITRARRVEHVAGADGARFEIPQAMAQRRRFRHRRRAPVEPRSRT